MSDIRKNQILRKKIKEKKKKQERSILVALGLVVTITLSIALISLSKTKNVNADTAQPISIHETINETKVETKNESVEKEKTEKVDKNKFNNIVIGYKKVVENSTVLETISDNPKRLFDIKPGEYIEFLGAENGWSKVSYKDIVGYVESSVLQDTNENELKVVNGVLLATKNFTIPKDFKTRFSVEAENAMMVMFEAMKREGLEISVSRKYIESDENIEENSDTKYPFPNIEQHELRTGRSIEFSIPNSATAVNFEDTAQGKWIKNNSYKFGFVQRYPSGKENITGFISNDRIYTYVGSEIAKAMQKNNLTMEEYFR